jgi:hypothetical protein
MDGVLSANDTAKFNQTLSSPGTVNLNGAKPRLSRLGLNTTGSSFTIAPGAGGTLTMQAPSGNALVVVYEGVNTISAPVILGSDMWVANNYWATVNFAGGISGDHMLTVAGTISVTSIKVDTLRIGNYPAAAAAVPEPSMLVLLAMGAAALAACSWRWRKA